jgi:hypothetical protein
MIYSPQRVRVRRKGSAMSGLGAAPQLRKVPQLRRPVPGITRIPSNGGAPPRAPDAELSFIDKVPVWVFPVAAAVVVGGLYWYTS